MSTQLYCPHNSVSQMILGQVLLLHCMHKALDVHIYCPHNSYSSVLQNDPWSSSSSTLCIYRALDAHTIIVPKIHIAVFYK